MQTEFKLPELGENIESGDVVNILVSEGETIDIDDPVLELETDKATVEVPSSVSGVVKKIHVQVGDTIKVGQLILTAGNGAAEPPVSPTKEESPVSKTETAAPRPESETKAETASVPVFIGIDIIPELLGS